MYATIKACSKQGRTVWALAAAFAALASNLVMSDELNGGKDCTAATIRGTYGFQMQGVRPVPPPTGGMENVNGVVLRTFDGYGSFSQVDNVKGSVTGIAPDRFGTGNYEVNADCSGMASFQPDPDNNPALVIEETFVILESGDEIRSITASPQPLMVTTVGKRVTKR